MTTLDLHERGSCEGAAHSELVTIGAPMLRRPSSEVADPASARELCEKLVALMQEIQGAGLAAPQIGIPLKVIVFQIRKTELHPDRVESPLYMMVNPLMLERSNEEIEAWEGCFSVPGYMGIVPRAKTVKVRYFTPDGLEHCEEFHDAVARVIQHECDHVEGYVYLDRMRSMRDLVTKPNYLHFELYKTHQM